MKRADIALYAAKDLAGSAHVFYDRALADHLQERMRTEQEIASGLLREEFFVEYQPVVSTVTREVAAFEALVRWQHPRRGVLGPEHFISVAERSGHMLALGRYVLGCAIADAGRWPGSIGIAVNVTGDEFRDPHFVRHIRTLLDIHSVKPDRLTLEITEAAFTMDMSIIQQGLADLRQLGVKVAIDDFGMGFSSINHLRQFPIDRLKIDRSFTRELLEGGRETELIEIILKLGKIFGISTTVEGVESEDQLEAVRALGAADVQGFLISRPLPAGAANALAYSRFVAVADMPARFSA
jgi:predicted signal transduction protein with EAL and GGDEF domain